MPINKTPMMQLIELRQGLPLERLIPMLMNRYDTVREAADSINIGEATLWRWMREFGFRTKFMEEKERYREERLERDRERERKTPTSRRKNK